MRTHQGVGAIHPIPTPKRAFVQFILMRIKCAIQGHKWTQVYDDTVLCERVMYRLCEKCGKIDWINF